VYFGTNQRTQESSQLTKMWIPLDIILTFNITLYQIFFLYIQSVQDKQEYIDSYSKLVIKEGYEHTLNHIVVNAKMTKLKNLLHDEFSKSCVIADQENGVVKESNNNVSIHKTFTNLMNDDGKENLRINKEPA
jgi:hypothetical protein